MPSRSEFSSIVRRCNAERVTSAEAMTKAVQKAIREIGDVAKRRIVEILVEEFSQLQAGTPYDTGRAQAGWLMDGDGISLGFKPGESGPFAPTVPSTPTLMQAHTIRVINNVEYILYLEAGWSKRQPGGFVAKFVDNIRRRVEAFCAREG